MQLLDRRRELSRRLRWALGLGLCLALAACRGDRPAHPEPVAPGPPGGVSPAGVAGTSVAPPPASTLAAPTTDPRLCALDPQGWCPAPAGDPCGAHADVASCRADPRCGGVRYRGESAIACLLDERGFGLNCPTVGCVSL
ncbi:MAG: hypothetical protein IT373_28975 [Polyangiaceae bacterium]|nr:hypothetical protein [Polyangiaceae bacterium]